MAAGVTFDGRPVALPSQRRNEMDDTMERGFDAVSKFLEARGLHHAVVEHPLTYTAGADARIAAVPLQHTAKAVMVRDDEGYVLTVIPASELLDLHKIRRLTGRPELRLATESELAADFPAFEVGALPPFGELFDCPEFIDHRLLAAARVLCNGGDHRHSIIVNTGELRWAAAAKACDIVREHTDDDSGLPRRPSRPAAR
jgi:Ala-tRNA(Pro) deacylase